MSIYSQAIGVSSDLLREETRALGDVGSKEIKSKEFAFDKTVEYNKAATDASKKYSNWKNTLGTIASIAAVASGVGAPMAALIAGGGTLAGGAIGKNQARQDLKGMDNRWFKGQQADLLKGMTKSTYTGALTSAVTAGVGAGSAKSASETATKQAAEALEETVKEGAGTGIAKATEYSGLEMQNKALLRSQGYPGESLVNELKSAGLESDFAYRKEMWNEYQTNLMDKTSAITSQAQMAGQVQSQDAYQNIWSQGFEGNRGTQSLMNLKFAMEGALGGYGKNPLTQKGWFK
jgi:hypothetical protein